MIPNRIFTILAQAIKVIRYFLFLLIPSCFVLAGSNTVHLRSIPTVSKLCPAPAPKSNSEQAKWEEWPGYWEKIAEAAQTLSTEPDNKLLMPVEGIRTRYVYDTFGALRTGGRAHEGQDIFARRGTPVYSVSDGVVLRIADGALGGLQIYILGGGELRYYYAHFSKINPKLREGQRVDVSTLLGYVGNTGVAKTTPSHLHFGIYAGSRLTCDYRALDPLSIIRDRNWKQASSWKADSRP